MYHFHNEDLNLTLTANCNTTSVIDSSKEVHCASDAHLAISSQLRRKTIVGTNQATYNSYKK